MQFAKLISFVFHPIIVPISSALLYFIIIPNHIPKAFSYRVLGLIFISTYVLPIILLFILKKIKFVEDFYLNSINERKFLVGFFTILSFLLGNLLSNNGFINISILAYFFYACGLALAIVYILFLFKIKTSLHTLALAGQISFISVISFQYKHNLLFLIIGLFILLGVVATARLKLKAHTLQEVVTGFIVGFLSQIVLYVYLIF